MKHQHLEISSDKESFMSKAERRKSKDIAYLLICLVLSTIIFIFDLNIQLGVAAGVPYVVVILISLLLSRLYFTLLFGILTSLLVLLGYYLSEGGGIEWMVQANRGLAIFVIWLTVILGVQLKNSKSILHENIQHFQLLVEQSSAMMWQSEVDGNWIFVSKGWLDFTGKTSEDELAKGWINSVHPDDKNRVIATFEKLIVEKNAFQLECRLKHNDEQYHLVTLNSSPCYSRSGTLTGFIGTGLDIDQQKRTALLLEETRQKYYMREKLASIGTLASGMLHEIGNPLASILGLLNEIEIINQKQTNSKDKTTIDKYLSMVVDELNRLTRISQDLSNFTSIERGEHQLTDLNALVERTCRLIDHDERMWQSNLVLEVNLAKDIPAVYLSTDQFIQLLQNIISNAIDACEQKKEAVINISSTDKGDHILLTIKDNGCGMSAGALAQVGQEFYTTKIKGTGLGLSICYSLVKQMEGTLTIKSTEGQGSEITITLPVKV